MYLVVPVHVAAHTVLMARVGGEFVVSQHTSPTGQFCGPPHPMTVSVKPHDPWHEYVVDPAMPPPPVRQQVLLGQSSAPSHSTRVAPIWQPLPEHVAAFEVMSTQQCSTSGQLAVGPH
jgi:hypothetical protein